jgi:hypothetical protein
VSAVQPQTITEAAWNALGAKLFGAEMDRWRFTCPHCGNVMSLHKARGMPPDELAALRTGTWSIESECIGRYLTGVGCDWAAYGLFSGPFFVTRSDGKRTPVFGFDMTWAT